MALDKQRKQSKAAAKTERRIEPKVQRKARSGSLDVSDAINAGVFGVQVDMAIKEMNELKKELIRARK